jgi:transaldolase
MEEKVAQINKNLEKTVAMATQIKRYVDAKGPIFVKIPKTTEGWKVLYTICNSQYSTTEATYPYMMISKRASYDHEFNLDKVLD